MPTFRDSESEFFNVISLDELDAFLERQHMIRCAKLHPKSKLKKEFEEIEKKNIVIIKADTDPYVFVSMSDALITDYSSIYFDYLFLDKPIIFFDYDLDAYLSESRDMYFKYEDVTPGVKAVNQMQLESALLDIRNGNDRYAKQRKELQIKMYDHIHEPSCERLVHEIQDKYS